MISIGNRLVFTYNRLVSTPGPITSCRSLSLFLNQGTSGKMRFCHGFCNLAFVISAAHALQPGGRMSTRRGVTQGMLLGIGTTTAPQAALAAKSRDFGYEVQRTDREWQYLLSGQQYFVLRTGGTEPPNSSPLVKEKRAGTFRCAGCSTALFDAAQKFESGTGWPSFAKPLAGVETVGGNIMQELLLGVEVRCGTCGGHLGDVFADGLLFPGTPAALTGKRYCIDGAALVFQPADGGDAVKGEGEVAAPELPSWLQPPPVGKPVG